LTLALKNLIRENLRPARAQFARRECIPRGDGGFSLVGGKKERENGEKKKRGRQAVGAGVKGIDRKYSGGIKINSVPGNICGW